MTSSPIEKTTWNAADYAANSALQQGWARELIATLNLRGDEQLLDVGCGDGKITAEIARALPKGAVVGIDASPEMIAFAQKTFPSTALPHLKFQVTDARNLHLPATFDVVFSNAALHWMDDHEQFLRGAASALKTGGRLVISCGGRGNAQEVFHALRPEMRQPRWRKFFRQMPPPYFFYAPADYEKWLQQSGFHIQTLKLAAKDVTYDGSAGLAAWLRTTWLPYVQRVPENQREEFIAAIVTRYVAKHPADAQGKIPVRLMRLDIDAVKL